MGKGRDRRRKERKTRVEAERVAEARRLELAKLPRQNPDPSIPSPDPPLRQRVIMVQHES